MFPVYIDVILSFNSLLLQDFGNNRVLTADPHITYSNQIAF